MAKITADQYTPRGERQFSTAQPDLTPNVSPVFSMVGSQTMDDVLKELRRTNGQIFTKILRDLIQEYRARRDTMQSLYQRYCGDSAGVPIKTRRLANPNKVNNRLANDFFGDIIDTKVGYFGTGISVELSKDDYYEESGEFNEDAYDATEQTIKDYRETNNDEDVNTDLTRMAACCGYGVKLLYKRAEEVIAREASIWPWEVVFIYDDDINAPQYAMRFYPVKIMEGDEKRERWRVEWYDAAQVWYFLETKDDEFIMDATVPVNPAIHLFDGVPLIAFPNNRQLQGDCEKVLDLIDAYDRTMSDVNSEIEQLRLAYMFVKGAGLNVDERLVESLRQTGIFPLGENGEVGYITKTIDDGVIEHHLDRLSRNIMRFGKSVDFGDEAFGGAMPVIAYQIKVAALEQKSKIAEMKFRAALRREYTLLCAAWARWGMGQIDPLDVNFKFTRNLPPNTEGEIAMLAQGTGLLSQKTLFSLMSFIKDPEEEIRNMEEEKQGKVDLDSIEPDEDEMNGDKESVGPGSESVRGDGEDLDGGGAPAPA